jgi:hypothetical protein
MKRRPAHRDGTRLARQVALLAVLSFFSSATPATAAACLGEVRALADDYALSIDPPDMAAQTSPETLTDELARSGGVIEPPATGDRAVIEPPETGSDMPTVPDVAPDEPPREGEGPVDLSPPDKVILESVLQAARAEAERGEEAGCFERLKGGPRPAAAPASEAVMRPPTTKGAARAAPSAILRPGAPQ